MATTLPNTGAVIPAMTEPADQAVNNAAFTAIDTAIGANRSLLAQQVELWAGNAGPGSIPLSQNPLNFLFIVLYTGDIDDISSNRGSVFFSPVSASTRYYPAVFGLGFAYLRVGFTTSTIELADATPGIRITRVYGIGKVR